MLELKLAFEEENFTQPKEDKKVENLTNFSGAILLLNLIFSLHKSNNYKFLPMLSLLNLRVIILSCIISQFPAMRFSCGLATSVRNELSNMFGDIFSRITEETQKKARRIAAVFESLIQ